MVAAGLLNWFKFFGIVRQLQSDQGSHFRNEVVEELQTKLKGTHHFTTPYGPQANGIPERANQTVLKQLRLLISESRLEENDWPHLLVNIAHIINHSPSAALGGLAPVTVHCGIKPSNPLSVCFLPDKRDFIDLSPNMDQIREGSQRLHATLCSLHEQLNIRAPRALPTLPGTQQIDFDVGDYCLVSSHRLGNATHVRDKLKPTWHGPVRIVEQKGPLTFVVQDLTDNTSMQVHARHLKRYADKYLLVQPQLVDFVAHCGRGHIIESIIGHRIKPKMELQVVWSTYSLAEPTWEPFSTIVRAIPEDVSRYIKTIVNPAERARLHASYKSLKPSK